MKQNSYFLATISRGVFGKWEAFEKKNTVPIVKCNGGTLMMWGCAAANDTGNILQAEERLLNFYPQKLNMLMSPEDHWTPKLKILLNVTINLAYMHIDVD